MDKFKFDLGEFAQAWCTKKNRKKVMDPDLAVALRDNAQRQFERWLGRQKTIYSTHQNVWSNNCHRDKLRAKVVYVEEIKDDE